MGSGEFHFFLKFTKKMLFSSFQVLLLISPQQWYLLWLATCSPAARLHHCLAFRNYSHTVYAVQAYAWPVRRCTAMTTYTYTRVRTLARIVQCQQSASMQEVCKKRTAVKNDGVLSRNAARSFRTDVFVKCRNYQKAEIKARNWLKVQQIYRKLS